MEAPGTQLAGHFHLSVWDWTLVCEDDMATSEHLLSAGTLGMVLDLAVLDCHRPLVENETSPGTEFLLFLLFI